jgi:hypothetical protein
MSLQWFAVIFLAKHCSIENDTIIRVIFENLTRQVLCYECGEALCCVPVKIGTKNQRLGTFRPAVLASILRIITVFLYHAPQH